MRRLRLRDLRARCEAKCLIHRIGAKYASCVLIDQTFPNVNRDVEKLQAFITARPQAVALLCVFGRMSHLEAIELPDGIFKERGSAVYADLKRTRYGCRIFQLKKVQP